MHRLAHNRTLVYAQSSYSRPLVNEDLPGLASDWRAGFFKAIFAKFEAGEEPPDIDVVHVSVLEELLKERGVDEQIWNATSGQVW
jgi:hypothetical protein